jgi:hypothetical protein
MAKPKFRFEKRDNPYGTKFAKRQIDIINGIEVENLKRTEVTIVIRKAEKLGHYDIAESVWERYEDFMTGGFESKYTYEEAVKILRKLTPWPTGW